MKTTLNINDDFEIKEANFNLYSEPFIHPSRIMTEFDFIYMLKGKWKIGQDEEEFSLKEDDLLILSPNHKHYGISECEKNTKTMYFHVSAKLNKVGEDLNLPSLNDCSYNSKIKNIFYEIIMAKQMGNDIKSIQYFKLLLLELSDNAYSSNMPTSNVALEIREIIHKHPEKFYSNNELAALVNVSTKSAENKFKSHFGVTIHQYILQYKIKEAISFFKYYPNMTIKEVSINLGFFDEYHFSKTFKKMIGLSPKQYKNNQW